RIVRLIAKIALERTDAGLAHDLRNFVDVVFALDAEMESEIDQRVRLADRTALLVERHVGPALVAYIEQDRRDSAADRGGGLGPHVFVIGIIDAEMAVRVDDS